MSVIEFPTTFLADLELAVWARQGRPIKGGAEVQFICPSHADRNPSARYNLESHVWTCDGCRAGGGALDLADKIEVARPSRSESPRPYTNGHSKPAPVPLGPVVAEYRYENVDGSPRFLVRRHDPKDFRIYRPDGSGGWIPGLGDVTPCLYQLVNVTAAVESNIPVLGAEGEKDADSLTHLGLCGTTSPMGAGKFRPEYADALLGATVWWFIDRDEPGRKHGQDVAQKCQGKVASFKLLEPPAPYKDVTEWIEAGATREDIEQLATNTPDWQPEAAPIDRTRAMSNSLLLRISRHPLTLPSPPVLRQRGRGEEEWRGARGVQGWRRPAAAVLHIFNIKQLLSG